MNAGKYLNTRLGRVNEAVKRAYAAGRHIVILVTSEPDFVDELINLKSLFPASYKMKDALGTTVTYECVRHVFSPSFIPAEPQNAAVERPQLIVWQGDNLPAESLQNYVRHCSGASFVCSTLDKRSDKAAVRQFDALAASLLLIVMPDGPGELPAEIVPYTETVTVPLLSKDEFGELVSRWLADAEGLALSSTPEGFDTIPDDEYLTRLYRTMFGMGSRQVLSTLAYHRTRLGKVYYDTQNESEARTFEGLLADIRRDAASILAQSSALTLIDTTNAPQPAGLGEINRWLEQNRSRVKDARRFEPYVMLPPNGIILSGIPGSGKSMMAKYIGNVLDVNLIRLDLGSALGKYVGDSEKAVSLALKLAEDLAPCVLWVDEMEKAFTGGHEVTTRIIGKFLTWMQEKAERGISCFLFATANDISKMPPELFRSGRFDEKFYTFMPSADEAAAIFSANVRRQCSIRRRSSPDNAHLTPLFDLSTLTAEAFIREILCSEASIRTEIATDQRDVARGNKFYIGADITHMIEKAKLIYLNAGYPVDSPSAVFRTDLFINALRTAADQMRSYGETNLSQIAECYAMLASQNFTPASGANLMPFSGYDVVRYNRQRRQQRTDPSIQPALYALRDEASHLSGKCLYDRQLYLAVRNTLNQAAESILSKLNR